MTGVIRWIGKASKAGKDHKGNAVVILWVPKPLRQMVLAGQEYEIEIKEVQ